VTYLNDKAKKYVEPLARELETPVLMPLDARGQMEAVFDRIGRYWGNLDFAVHSIAFSAKDALQGRVVSTCRARAFSPPWTCPAGHRHRLPGTRRGAPDHGGDTLHRWRLPHHRLARRLGAATKKAVGTALVVAQMETV
jgi:Enoyl-(Acyl carrier protein) reductase